MPSTVRRRAALLVVIAAVSGCRKQDDSYAKQVEAFRHKHEADYRKEYVPLSGLYFLNPGENRAGSAPDNDMVLPPPAPAKLGVFTMADDSSVRFTPAGGTDVTINGRSIAGETPLVPDGDKEKADELQVAGMTMWVHKSGDRRTIRVRDENGAAAKSFKGFHWFPIDPHYRVTATFTRDSQPRQIKIPNILGDDETYTTEGTVRFTLDGRTITMRPMTTRPGRLYFIFKDGTSGKETYHTARFLYADLKDDGTTVLDFNEAYNPPCAFNEYTTCPLPPKENQLSVRILAGEKDYPRDEKASAPTH